MNFSVGGALEQAKNKKYVVQVYRLKTVIVSTLPTKLNKKFKKT